MLTQRTILSADKSIHNSLFFNTFGEFPGLRTFSYNPNVKWANLVDDFISAEELSDSQFQNYLF